jgi:hypothetical protein
MLAWSGISIADRSVCSPAGLVWVTRSLRSRSQLRSSQRSRPGRRRFQAPIRSRRPIRSSGPRVVEPVSEAAWTTTYQRYLLQSPRIWSVHVYDGISRDRLSQVSAFLKWIKTSATPSPSLWITEAGPRYNLSTPGELQLTRNFARFLGRVRNINDGSLIKAIYYYSWVDAASFDSGLLDLNGALRTTDSQGGPGPYACFKRMVSGATSC